MKSARTARECRASPSPQQQTLPAVMEAVLPYEKKGKRWKELTDSVTYCLAKDGLPIYTVEKPGFRNLLKSFDPRYNVPSRKYFSEVAIPTLYSAERSKLFDQLSYLVHFSSTTDLWSSTGLKPYISYTIHYIDVQWNLQSKCLQTHFLPEDHTGEILAESLTTTMELWNLKPENQVCITTDSGSNIVKATTRDLKWTRLSCFGHNLHLSITKSMDGDSRCHRALGTCRKIVSTFHCSWKKKRDLSKCLINMNITDRSLVSVS